MLYYFVQYDIWAVAQEKPFFRATDQLRVKPAYSAIETS